MASPLPETSKKPTSKEASKIVEVEEQAIGVN